MNPDGLAFEEWKMRLQEDCKRLDKLLVYSNLGEECLKILWEAGTAPSVEGVIEGGQQVPGMPDILPCQSGFEKTGMRNASHARNLPSGKSALPPQS